jgi:hypothetical protein
VVVLLDAVLSLEGRDLLGTGQAVVYVEDEHATLGCFACPMRSRMRSRSASAKTAAVVRNSFGQAVAGDVAAQFEEVELHAPQHRYGASRMSFSSSSVITSATKVTATAASSRLEHP